MHMACAKSEGISKVKPPENPKMNIFQHRRSHLPNCIIIATTKRLAVQGNHLCISCLMTCQGLACKITDVFHQIIEKGAGLFAFPCGDAHGFGLHFHLLTNAAELNLIHVSIFWAVDEKH